MEFVNRKKIQAKGAYFQISKSIHEKYGSSLALGIVPKKTVNGKLMPNYDEVKTIFCSFNQASKIANKLFVAANEAVRGSDEILSDKFFEYQVGKTNIEFEIDIRQKEVLMTFANGDSKQIILDVDTAFVVSDLIKSRLIELDMEDEKEESKEIQPENLDSIKIKEYNRIKVLLEETGFFTSDGIQQMIELERKKNPKVDYLDVVKELALRVGVKL